MVNTKTTYIVYNHNGGGVRHHHFGVQNNIIAEADGHASTGDTIPALGIPTMTFQGQNVPFAFMSVSGAADGSHLYTAPGNQLIAVGSTDIEILVVYAPPGGIGGPGGGPGVWVDAFNVDTGDFSDADFIAVLTPPTPPVNTDAPKSSLANSDGSVSTAAPENLRAFADVDGGVPFVQWKQIVGAPVEQTSADVQLNQNETGEIWLAFYQHTASSGPVISIKGVINEAVAGIMVWTGDDFCGNGGHILPIHGGGGPGPGPGFQISIPEKIVARMTPENRQKLAGIQKTYPALAQAAHVEMTRVVDTLKSVVAILPQSE